MEDRKRYLMDKTSSEESEGQATQNESNRTAEIAEFNDLPAEIKLNVLQCYYEGSPVGMASLLPLRLVSRAFNAMTGRIYSMYGAERAKLIIWREEWYEDNGGVYLKQEGDPFAVVDTRNSSFKERAFYFNNVPRLEIDTAILDVEHLDPVIDKICDIVLKCEKIRSTTVKVSQMRASFMLQIRRQIQDIFDGAMKRKRKGYHVALNFVGNPAQG